MSICDNCNNGVMLLTIFTKNSKVIIRIGGEEMFRIVVGIYNNLSKNIVDMLSLTPLTHQMFQNLCEQSQSITFLTPINRKLDWQET